jgi:hypothetical protein
VGGSDQHAAAERNQSSHRKSQGTGNANPESERTARTEQSHAANGAESSVRGTVKYWEIVADNFNKAGWSWGCVSAIDSNGQTIWIADAHRGDGKRFIVPGG